jgi:hypothetical protein
MGGYKFVVLQGRGPDGNPTPLELDSLSLLRVAVEAQNLTVKQKAQELTTDAIDLDTVEGLPEKAPGGWELVSASAWLVGDAEGQARPVAANEPWSPPGNTLAGVFAKSASGTITLVITGGVVPS